MKTSKGNKGKNHANKILSSGVLVCGLLAGTMVLRALADENSEQATLKGQAAVTKSEAKKVALGC